MCVLKLLRAQGYCKKGENRILGSLINSLKGPKDDLRGTDFCSPLPASCCVMDLSLKEQSPLCTQLSGNEARIKEERSRQEGRLGTPLSLKTTHGS